MKVYLHENRADRNVTLLGVKFVEGEADVYERDHDLIDMLKKYFSVQTEAPAQAKPAKAAKPAKVEAPEAAEK